MKDISIKEVSQIAVLARLKLKPEELFLFQKQLIETLNYIEILSEIESSIIDSKATYQVTPLVNIYREDTINYDRLFSQAEALSNAANKFKGYFVVPSVFVKEEESGES